MGKGCDGRDYYWATFYTRISERQAMVRKGASQRLELWYVGRAPRFPPPDLGIGIVTAPALACGVVVQDTAIIVEK